MPDIRVNNTTSSTAYSSPPANSSRSGPPPVFMPELQKQALQSAYPQLNTADSGTARSDLDDDLQSPPDDETSASDDETGDDSVDGLVSADLSSLSLPTSSATDSGTADAAPAPSAGADSVQGTQTDDSLGLDALAANLAGLGSDNGIFEVTMPNGQQLGVAVNVQPTGVRFLMSPSDNALRDRIKNCRMELEGAVEQHIHKDVEIAVL